MTSQRERRSQEKGAAENSLFMQEADLWNMALTDSVGNLEKLYIPHPASGCGPAVGKENAVTHLTVLILIFSLLYHPRSLWPRFLAIVASILAFSMDGWRGSVEPAFSSDLRDSPGLVTVAMTPN
jgi:hypothetical protein